MSLHKWRVSRSFIKGEPLFSPFVGPELPWVSLNCADFFAKFIQEFKYLPWCRLWRKYQIPFRSIGNACLLHIWGTFLCWWFVAISYQDQETFVQMFLQMSRPTVVDVTLIGLGPCNVYIFKIVSMTMHSIISINILSASSTLYQRWVNVVVKTGLYTSLEYLMPCQRYINMITRH